jgi:tetratricopeptide (TPR) repeat protein
MKFACLFLTLAVCVPAHSESQQAATGNFQELAQRASAALANDPQQAITLSRQALDLQPTWAEGWFNIGAASYQLGQYTEARQAFLKARELAPDKGAVWAFLGLTDYQLHDEPDALECVQKAESIGLPDNRGFMSAVRNAAATLLLTRKDYGGAVEQLRPLALLGDDSPQTIAAFGVSALGLPYVPSAVPVAKRDLVELAGRAEWAMCANRDTPASSALRELVTKYPREPGVHYLNGLHLVANDPEAARGEFQKELQISPSHIPARLQIAIIDIRTDDPAAAAALATQALHLEPDNALAHAVLGRADMQQSQFEKALPELLAAAKLAPENAQIHLYLEQVYGRLGRNAEAQQEKAAFLRLHSAHDSTGLPALEATKQ